MAIKKVSNQVIKEEAWTAWSPNITNLSPGSTGTKVGSYIQIGKTVHFRLLVTLGGTGISVGAITVPLPVAAHAGYYSFAPIGNVIIVDGGATVFMGTIFASGVCWVKVHGATYIAYSATSSTVPMGWAATDTFAITGTYEAA